MTTNFVFIYKKNCLKIKNRVCVNKFLYFLTFQHIAYVVIQSSYYLQLVIYLSSTLYWNYYLFSPTIFHQVDLQFNSFATYVQLKDFFSSFLNRTILPQMLPFPVICLIFLMWFLWDNCSILKLELFEHHFVVLTVERFQDLLSNFESFLLMIVSTYLFFEHSPRLQTHQVFSLMEFYPICFDIQY